MRPLVRIGHREMHTPLARYFQDSTIDFEIVTLEVGDIEIGDNCTIGANSVINKSFSNNSIIVGSPGKKIVK